MSEQEIRVKEVSVEQLNNIRTDEIISSRKENDDVVITYKPKSKVIRILQSNTLGAVIAFFGFLFASIVLIKVLM